MMITKIQCKLVFALAFLLQGAILSRAQFSDSSTGLLQIPTAEMQDDGTFMITTNFLNKHSLPTSGWGYNTVQYGIYVSFWGRMEIGYVCTIFNDYWAGYQHRPGANRVNQDRHFTGRVKVLRENEFGLKWIPALVVGVSDPTTGSGGGEYISGTEQVTDTGNGYFNRFFAVMTKHFDTPWGRIGAHAGYQFNRRADYRINALALAWTGRPFGFKTKEFWTT